MWLRIAVLLLLTAGVFTYLIHWLDLPEGREETRGLAENPLTNHQVNSGEKVAGNEFPNAVLVSQGNGSDSGKGTNVQNPVVKMAFVGDVMFASKVDDLLKKNGYDYPYKYVKSYLEKADIAVANLETPVTTKGEAQKKEYVYRSSPFALPEMKKAGIDLVNLANNHSMDYGQEGLIDTLTLLDEQGIKHVGAGMNSAEAYSHVLLEQNGIKIAFLGFSRVVPETSWYAGKSKPGIAETYSTKLPTEAIAKARGEADLVVVILHWGEERKDRPAKIQTDLAHQYIDEGADLVIASHPHVLQGLEQYKGKWIAYSLGNFIFTTNETPETWESVIVEASCTKERNCDLHLVPILTKWGQPIRMVTEDSQKLFGRLGNISINAQIDSEGRVFPGPVNAYQSEAAKPSASGVNAKPDTNSGNNGSGSPNTKPPKEGGKKAEQAKLISP